MRTIVAMTPGEIHRLERLRGEPFDSLWTDGWGVWLRSGTRTLDFLPEEVPLDNVFHPYDDVVRLRVEEKIRHASPAQSEVSGSLGRILRLARMSTAIVSSPPNYQHPDDPSLDRMVEANRGPVVIVDVGVAIEAEGGWSVVSTNGTGFWVSTALEGSAEEKLACLAGKVLLVPVFTS